MLYGTDGCIIWMEMIYGWFVEDVETIFDTSSYELHRSLPKE